MVMMMMTSDQCWSIVDFLREYYSFYLELKHKTESSVHVSRTHCDVCQSEEKLPKLIVKPFQWDCLVKCSSADICHGLM